MKTTVGVRIPTAERAELEREASANGYKNLSDYIRQLIHVGRTRQWTEEYVDGVLLSEQVYEQVEMAVRDALAVHFAGAVAQPVEDRLRPIEERLTALPGRIEAQVRSQVQAELHPTLKAYRDAFEAQRTRLDGVASTVTASMESIGRSLENITGKLNELLDKRWFK